MYGVIEKVQFVHDEGSNKRLIESEESVVFHVARWKPLRKTIRPVGYGIQFYSITTLNTIKEAKELPELFIKSKEELVLWRTLRRISQEIKTELDNENLDDVAAVNSFKLKDLEVLIDRENQEAVVVREGNRLFKISIEKVKRSPSSFFKRLLDY